ncbi:MAG: ABC transporter ATP-binding protein [Aestuariivita sp.]|nr:ABC transporter ATP-binding protein [Aestuariivita sp.]
MFEQPPILKVEDVHTRILSANGILHPVDGVSFELNAGETLGVVGESGSGKSLLALSLLNVLPKPSSEVIAGKVLFNGEDLLKKTQEGMRHIRGKDIAMILQDPQTSLNPVFKVGHQILEALTNHNRNAAPLANLRALAVDALRRVGVSAPEMRYHSYPHQMSGGMKQRSVGAIAISGEPQVIIADEPTTSLDVTIQAQYLRLLREFQEQQNLALLFITHDFGVVAKLCHRVMVMYAGRVVETGPVLEIFDRPSHPYTQALLNSVASLRNEMTRLPSIPGQPPPLWDLPKGCRFAPRCPLADGKCKAKYPEQVLLGSDETGTHTASCWKAKELHDAATVA